MWHKKWNEREEMDASSGEATAEAMERMQDLMDIVGEESSTISHPNITGSIIGDSQLLAAAIDSVTASSAAQQGHSHMQVNSDKNQQITGLGQSQPLPVQAASHGDSGVNDSSVPLSEKSEHFTKELMTEKTVTTDVKDGEERKEIIKGEFMDVVSTKTGVSSLSDNSGKQEIEEDKSGISGNQPEGDLKGDQSGLVKAESPKDPQEAGNLLAVKEIKSEPEDVTQSEEGIILPQNVSSDNSSQKQEKDSNSSSAEMEVGPSQSGTRLGGDDDEGEGIKKSNLSSNDEVESLDKREGDTVPVTESEDLKKSCDLPEVLSKEEEKEVHHEEREEEPVDAKKEIITDKKEELSVERTDSTEKEDAEEIHETNKDTDDDKTKDHSKEVDPKEISCAEDKSKENEDTSVIPKKEVGDMVTKETGSQEPVDTDVDAKVLSEGDSDKLPCKDEPQASDGNGSTEMIIKNEEIKEEVPEGDDLNDLKIPCVDGIPLPHPEEMDTSDLTHPEDLEGTEEVLDEEDGDDLAIDLEGIESAGEGGMPENSDLAALLSSHTELEQLVNQASSALSSHVPAPVSHPG